jgi:DNA-binding Lrp family transcriptional regulator
LAVSDIHLLRVLTRDGPQTIAALAQRLHLKVQTARYRIARLRKRGALQWGRSGGGAYVVSLTRSVGFAPREGSSATPSRGEATPQAAEVSAVEVRTVVVNGHLFDVVFSGRESLTSGAPGLGSTLSGRGFPIRL